MILEIATLDIKPGQTAEFEATFDQAQHIISGIPGYVSHQLQHCLEQPNRYVLLVNWETLEDHTEGFRGSAQYQDWQRQMHPFFQPSTQVEHYELVK